ncbi:MAG: hypothetical protein V1837_02665 [Candidatus Woesearchaeota archaeon]
MITRGKEYRTIACLALIALYLAVTVLAAPVGPDSITYVQNASRGVKGPIARTQDERGTITTIRINVTQQSLYWKAYLGNVSGKITLDDNLNYTMFDWTLTSSGGEVFASRKASTVLWTSIRCANKTVVEAESLALNHTFEKTDGLNKTFRRNNHTSFFVGNQPIGANSCNHTAHPYVNDGPQKSSFSEVLLYDTEGWIVYASVMNQSVHGYNNQHVDFQMLVGEKGQEGFQTPVAYYFYVELT